MKEYIITKDNEGQRIDRFLQKLLPGCTKGFIQKSLRKKNIKLNNKKAANSDYLKENDTVTIYFSDETFDKFSNKNSEVNKSVSTELKNLIKNPSFENENFFVLSKPVNLLTQADKSGNENLADAVKSIYSNNDSLFKIAPLNRLDRNTSGIVIFPKNYNTQKIASKAIKERNSSKKYLTIVKGEITKSGKLEDKYNKDSDKNKAEIGSGESVVKLEYKPLFTNNGYTLLEVNLLTGKSHQIRTQLAHNGTPIVGDYKYGDKKLNDYLKTNFKLDHQLLHAFNYKLYNEDQEILNVLVDRPKEFKKIEKQLLGEVWDIGKSNMD